MRLKNVPGAAEKIAVSKYNVAEPKNVKGKWQKLFGNQNPIFIEVGMGKGQFITTLAKMNPQINYIGIEKYSSVLVRAVEKVEEEELENLRFIRMDAEELPEVFGKEEIDKIYLNFSDPWPKERHAKRRLTSVQFLDRYDQILKKNGKIEFKTDNRSLFEFSLEQAPLAHWTVEAFTFDLHKDEKLNEGNIMTEYEEKFSQKGNPIHKMILSRTK